ncbi:MAG: sensor histidine kinase [Bacteroidota bacterium]
MPEKELFITIVCTVLLFMVSTVVIVMSVVRYVKKGYLHRQELLTMEMEVQEQTRKNLAGDLHDNIGQLLSLTNVTIGSININEPDKAKHKLQEVQLLVERSVRELRQLSKIIHGEMVLQGGLVAAITQEIGWLERNGFYQVEFINDTDKLDVSYPEKDLFLYRLLQEALNNAIKHAAADRLHILLHYQDDQLQLQVTDNGSGFDPGEKAGKPEGLGLANMRKRVDLLGGTIEILSTKEAGTSITILIPYPNTKDDTDTNRHSR